MTFDTRFLSRHPAWVSLGLGGLATTGFAPLELWPATFGCVALWMGLVHEAADLKAVLLRGWAFGVGHFVVGNNWIQHAFTFQDAMPHWLGYLAVLLLSLYLGIYPMLAAGLAWRFVNPRAAAGGREPLPSVGFVLVFGAAWIVTEWLRASMFTGYAWGPLGIVWLPLSGVAHAAAWIGTYALSGLAIVVSGALVLLKYRRWHVAAPVLAGIALLAATGLAMAPAVLPANAPRVRVVQPNLSEEDRPGPNYAENSLRALSTLSGTPGPVPRLIVWPEGATRYDLEDGYPSNSDWPLVAQLTRRRIAALLGARDVMLTGGQALIFDAAGNTSAATNSVFAIDSKAQIVGRYDKAHLVPYGEYLPARPILSAIGLSKLVPGDIDFLDGPGPRALTLPAFGAVGVQICYEIIFSGQTVDPQHRPVMLFNPSNDAWFGHWGPPQHLAQARLRAIEEGLPVIRATPTGISAIIDAHGRILASLPAETSGAIELPIPQAAPPTLFSRAGNWMAFLVAGAMLLLAIAIRRSAR